MGNGSTLFDRLLHRRDLERQAGKAAKVIVSEDEATFEVNRQSPMRWYVHPNASDITHRSLIVYRYEIPPHSRTGKQKSQGNVVSYVLSGSGRTVANGIHHHWEAGDLVALPPLEDGVVFQHFNDSDETAMLISAEPNLLSAFGVDMGCGLEQLEDYVASRREADEDDTH